MKHLHLATGLLICAYLVGCGDYGDDGAVNSTGIDTADLTSTDFNLALALPTFDTGSGKLRLARKPGAISRAVTGSSPVEDLAQSDVRAYVIVPDNSIAAGFREVAIDVVEFENLQNGRYRIAIDGQAQVDGFFAITIDGVVFRIPLSRTGTTDEPIDVNALQAALADRLQALLVADGVCAAVTTAQLNTILDQGQDYIASLTVPDDIGDVGALIEFYRVSVAGFMQQAIDGLCAPALNTLAVDALPGDYHRLQSGMAAYLDDLSAQAATNIEGYTAQLTQTLVLDEVDPALITLTGQVLRDDRYRVSHAAGSSGTNGLLSDLSVLLPDVGSQQVSASMVAFASDADRVALQHAELVEVAPDTGRQGFVAGFTVAKTPAWQQIPQGTSLIGASQSSKSYIDLTAADAGCLTSLGLTSAVLADSAAFGAAAQAAIDAVGAAEFANRLQADCGGVTPLAYEINLQLDTRFTSIPLTGSDLTGRYALVGFETTQVVSSNSAMGGYRGTATDLLFDIDVEGVMSLQGRNQSRAFQPATAPLGGIDTLGVLEGNEFAIELPLDQTQAPVTDGSIQIRVARTDGVQELHPGFVSAAPHNLMAVSLAGRDNNGGRLGGYTLVDSLPAATGGGVTASGDLALAYGSGGIQAVDVSDPQNLQLISALGTIGLPQAVAIDANRQYAYVAAGSQGLQIVDISNPAEMTVVGAGIGSPTILSAAEIALVLNAQGEAVLALVGDGGILHAVNVTTPAAPEALGSYDFGGSYINALAVTGNAVLVGSYGELFVMDLSQFLDANDQSNSFTLIPDTLQINDYVSDIAVQGSVAYLAANYDGLYAIDVANLASVAQVGYLQFSNYAVELAVDGDRAFVALTNEGYAGTAVVDISDTANPQLLAEIPATGDNSVANGYLLVATGTTQAGVVAVDVRSASAAQLVGQLAVFNSNPLLAVAGTVAYVATFNDGLSAVDISDPTKPAPLDVLDATALGGAPTAITVEGGYAYVVTNAPGLVIVDIADPANLAVVGTPFTVATYPSSVTAFSQGATRYVAIGAGPTLALIDVTTPAAPTLAQTVTLSDTPYDVAVSSDGLFAYVATYLSMEVVNMTFIGNAVVVGSAPDVTYVNAVEVSNNHVYVTTFYDGLVVIDVSTPATPVVVGSYYDLQGLTALRLVGSTAYLLGNYGMSVVDVTDPAAITALGFVPLPNTMDIAISGGHLLAGSYDGAGTPPYALDVYELTATENVTTGMAVGVRMADTALVEADLVGRQFTLAGQQATQLNDPSTSRQAVFSALAGGNLRFAAVGGDVYPVFDLPLSGLVVADFSGVMPRLEIGFEQWVAEPVVVDTNGRWSFTAASSSGDEARFAGYMGADGTLVGRISLFVADPARAPVPGVVNGGIEIAYPGLLEASQAIIIGVPRAAAAALL